MSGDDLPRSITERLTVEVFGHGRSDDLAHAG